VLAAATALRESDPASFRLLSTVSVTFRYSDAGAQLENARTIIELDRCGEIQSVAYNNRGQAPLPLGLAASSAFYFALAALVRIAADDRFILRARFSKGAGVVFNNGAILHGRSAYSSGAGAQRLLQGC
jgi:gamma-butyrobetaine dioxygenase